MNHTVAHMPHFHVPHISMMTIAVTVTVVAVAAAVLVVISQPSTTTTTTTQVTTATAVQAAAVPEPESIAQRRATMEIPVQSEPVAPTYQINHVQGTTLGPANITVQPLTGTVPGTTQFAAPGVDPHPLNHFPSTP